MERQRWGEAPACPRCGDTAYVRCWRRTAPATSGSCGGAGAASSNSPCGWGRSWRISPDPASALVLCVLGGVCGQEGRQRLADSAADRLELQVGPVHDAPHPVRHDSRCSRPKLTGIVEADETYVGGKVAHRHAPSGWRMRAAGLGGCRSTITRRCRSWPWSQRGGDVRAMVVPTVTAEQRPGGLLPTWTHRPGS